MLSSRNLEPARESGFFVFDQVNDIFAREQYKSLSKISALGYPFNMIQRVIIYQAATSVISASSNNEVALYGNERFVDFEHVTEMSDNELNELFLRVPLDDLKEKLDPIKEFAGAVPQYVKKYLESDSPDKFMSDIIKEVSQLVEKLRPNVGDEKGRRRWIAQQDSIICCLLGKPTEKNPHYDRKYLVPNTKGSPGECVYEPLFPAVIEAYRRYFFDEILECVKENEQ
jgi:hypothetical protein